MKFTVKQLALLGSIFWDDRDNFEEFEIVAQAIKDFIDLGDRYDIELLMTFIKSALPEKPKGALAKEETLKHFVGKCEYWFKPV